VPAILPTKNGGRHGFLSRRRNKAKKVAQQPKWPPTAHSQQKIAAASSKQGHTVKKFKDGGGVT